jgi:oligoribonuclease NrnB/cAMP/cGMP phosphodiesterase (DHH superfamily)
MEGIRELDFTKTIQLSGYKFDFSKISLEEILEHLKVRFHNDLDGYASAAQVFLYYFMKYKNMSIYNKYTTGIFKYLLEDSKIMESINYDYEIDFSSIKKDTIFWILDYSFSNPDHILQLEKLAERCEKDNIAIYWIDHHKTSLDLINPTFIEEHPAFRNINIYLTNKSAACVAVYDYFHEPFEEEIKEIINCRCKINTSSIILTHLWDTFDIGEQVLRFKYGMEMSDINPSTVNGIITWKDLLITGHINIKDMIEKGTPIRNAIHDYHNYQLRDIYEVEFEGHRIFIMNTTEHNSLVFEEKFDDPDALYCVWSFNGRKFIYSLYSTKLSNISCEAIAKKYSGGGHPHAAGFQLDTFLF